MTSGIDSDILADAGSRPTGLHWIAELGIGDATRKLAHSWAASSLGLYEGYWVDEGQISLNLFPQRDQASIEVQDDTTASLERAIMADSGGAVAGSTATLKLASTTRATSKWFIGFSGVIEDFESPSYRRWRFDLKRDDQELYSLVKIPYIKEPDWPNALEFDIPAHVVYGKHSSVRTAETGVVPTIYVDRVNFRYLVSVGFIAAVHKVYVDGVRQTSGWTADLSFYRGGRYWSIITFTADQGDDAVVTVDCDGVTDGGVITNPATQLEHFLSNFVFGSWVTDTANSAWLATSSRVDTTHFDEVETFLTDKQIARGGRVITAGRKASDVVSEWLNQWGVSALWTYGGKFAIRADKHQTTGYITAPHLRHEISPNPRLMVPTFDATNLFDEVNVEYLYAEASSAFLGQLTVRDGTKSIGSAKQHQMQWRESVK